MRIIISLPEAAPVGLTVLDVRGRVVARLLESSSSAGTHEFIWSDATDPGPASGLYFIHLETPRGHLIQRVLVVH